MRENEFAVSVIIPFYNVERYFQECLDSLTRQTFQNFEVILIDDGSIDASIEIAENFSLTHKNVNIIKQDNLGQGKARNQGLKRAKGKYVYFLDSDDYLLDHALEMMWHTAEEYCADLVLFEGETIYDTVYKERFVANESENDYKRKHKYTKNIYKGIDIFRELRRNKDYSCSVWLQLVRRETLNENNIWFPENIIHEDELYSFLVFMNCRKVHVLSNSLCCHRYRSGSTMTSARGRQNFWGYQKTYQGIIEWNEKNSISKKDERTIKECEGDFFRDTIYGIYFRLPKEEQYAIKKEVDDFVLFAKKKKGFEDWKLYLISTFWKPYCWFRQRKCQ